MPDERTGLSSYGQQLLDDLILNVRALVEHVGPEVVTSRRVDLAQADRAAAANAAASALGPPEQAQIDALQAQIRDLMNRLPPVEAPPPAPPLAPFGAPAPTPGQPFEGQTPMVVQPGPTV